MKSCPNCSADLVGHSCKLRCSRCSYFESCSDLEPYPTDFGASNGEGRLDAEQSTVATPPSGRHT